MRKMIVLAGVVALTLDSGYACLKGVEGKTVEDSSSDRQTRAVVDANECFSDGSVAKFRWPREDELHRSGAGHVRVQVASF